MTALRTVVSISALVATFTGASPGALAQTGKTQLAQVKPAAAASTWTCPFSVVELAPVSEETNGKAQAWVMVHRVNGEIVAADDAGALLADLLVASLGNRVKLLPNGPPVPYPGNRLAQQLAMVASMIRGKSGVTLPGFDDWALGSFRSRILNSSMARPPKPCAQRAGNRGSWSWACAWGPPSPRSRRSVACCGRRTCCCGIRWSTAPAICATWNARIAITCAASSVPPPRRTMADRWPKRWARR